MTVAPGLRKLALTAHISASVGWLGAVGVYLALAVTGVAGRDAQTVRAAYLAMELIVRFVILPLALASLLTGLASALASPWGLFRHYWVLIKLVLNVVTTAVLLLYTASISYFAGLARDPASSGSDLGELRNPTHAVHAGAALVVLLLATVLAVYKPRGLTRYGQRKHDEQRRASQGSTPDERPLFVP
jgi:hypothetical protein